MSITPKAIQDLLDELEASKQSRLRAWNALQRIRALLSDLGKTELPRPASRTIDLEGRLVKDGVRKALKDKRNAVTDLVQGHSRVSKIYRSIAHFTRMDYAHAVQELNKAIDRAQALCSTTV